MERAPKNPEIYEALMLFGGFFGLHWLYAGRTAPFLTRFCHALSGFVLLGTGLSFVHVPLMLAGLAFLAMVAGLWAYDYATRGRALAAPATVG